MRKTTVEEEATVEDALQTETLILGFAIDAGNRKLEKLGFDFVAKQWVRRWEVMDNEERENEAAIIIWILNSWVYICREIESQHEALTDIFVKERLRPLMGT